MSDDERWRNLGFEETQAAYKSGSQNARVWTEGWVANHLYCPNCSSPRLSQHPNNSPVADFGCQSCGEDYELKSQKGRFGPRVADGAYRTMLDRLKASDNPNLILMNYDLTALSVTNLIVVPKQFFTANIVEARRPLALTARRAGWQGCNILLRDVPDSGKIWLVRDRQWTPQDEVLASWRRTLFLRTESLAARGWLLEVMKCVEGLGRSEFTLEDVYACEQHLSGLFPANKNVRPKIRRQLQVLRDRGFLEFAGRGAYRLTPNP